MNTGHVFAQQPDSYIAQQAEQKAQKRNLNGGAVSQFEIVAAFGYLADGIEGYAEAGEQHDIAHDGVLEIHHSNAFWLQYTGCIRKGHDREDESRYRVDIV